jgi:pimeloyl-ACP methyl ester carboxylesterase
VKVLLFPFRVAGNLLLAVVIFATIIAILLGSFGAVYLPYWEKTALENTPADGQFIWVEGSPVYYRTWGEPGNPPVVLVHGHGVEGSTVWETSAPELAGDGLYVVAVDLLGYGRSARGEREAYTLKTRTRTLAQVLNNLELGPATVVGYAEGAGVALQLAVEQPQFVQGLVLLSPRVEGLQRPLWRVVAEIPYVGTGLAWALDSGGPLWRLGQYTRVADPANLPDDYVERADAYTRITGTAESLRVMGTSAPDDNLPEAIPGLDMPVLVVVGNRDRAFEDGEAEELTALFAQGDLIVLPKAAEAVQFDQTELVTDRIAAFAFDDALRLVQSSR